MNILRPLGSTGLQCHCFGFGCYRVMKGDPEHDAALRAYLERGGNLIDTSANYGDGASEELVGEVLRDYPRAQVIVVTKGGYIQGQNMALAGQRHFPEVVRYAPGIWHSIHPEFLETQIERSSARMQQDYLDVFLLHNPEYFLDDVGHHRPLASEDYEEFYRRVRQAFRFLEEKVAQRRIGCYGISSNNFGQPAFDPAWPAMTSVTRCLEEAHAVSPHHHFRVVQLPLNLYEPGAALEPNNDGQSVLDFCRQKGLGVLANRPLNAFHENRLIRLADWTSPGASAPGIETFQQQLAPLENLERSFQQLLGRPLRLSGGESITELFLRLAPQLRSLSHFEQVVGHHIVEPIQAWFVQAREQFGQHPGWGDWQKQSVEAVNQLLGGLQSYLRARQQAVSDQVRAGLLAAGYPPNGQSLSRMALHVLSGLEGLSSILVGMRRRPYVEDVLGIADFGEIDALPILKRFSSRCSQSA